jgi:hypothetical protein
MTNRTTSTDDNSERLDWHAAFRDAIRLEFLDYIEFLRFEFEHCLSTQPLKIDAVIIKKLKGAVITKNIGRCFRNYNIIEYKSPDDYFSIKDWHKTLAYVHLYVSQEQGQEQEEGVSIDNVTLTIIEARHPLNLLKYLEKRFTVSGGEDGIYKVSGQYFPVQIIESALLPADENLWLANLKKCIDIKAAQSIEYQMKDKDMRELAQSYINVVRKANADIFTEAIRMMYPTMEQIYENAGITKKWEARGQKQVLDMVRQGKTADEIERILAEQDSQDDEHNR